LGERDCFCGCLQIIERCHQKVYIEDWSRANGGSWEKKECYWILSYLDQEKFRLAEAIYVPCAKAEKLFYCDVKAKCPRMRELIHGQWLMMNGNTEFVEDGQSHHPCYRMYKHDHSNMEKLAKPHT
jgi:hypothetical protein